MSKQKVAAAGAPGVSEAVPAPGVAGSAGAPGASAAAPARDTSGHPGREHRGRPPFPKWLVIGALAVLVACILIPKVNWRYIGDWFDARDYAPSAEVDAIRANLGLTDYADTVFRATAPVLEDNASFNAHCESFDAEISIVGCYTNDTIYLYDIDTATYDLAGILESTAAHELLHAIWDRLSPEEQSKLQPLLEEVYTQHQDLLASELENYTDDARIDELYARAATEVRDLPADLESHYARFFTNQDALVDFYDAYNATFEQMQAEFDALNAEMEALNTEIEDLRVEIEETALYDVDAANRLVDLANAKVRRYNELVEQYNQNVLRSQELNAAVNSNAPADAGNGGATNG